MFETCSVDTRHADLAAPSRPARTVLAKAREPLPLTHEVDGVAARRVPVTRQPVGPTDDPIHEPLLEEYRRSTGQPPGGVDEAGQRVAPSDAELKVAGVLGRFGTARWLDPVINRRNLAEVYFRSQPLTMDAGLTTQFVNEREIHSNTDVLAAIPRPAIESRTEGGRTLCWFAHGVGVTGRTTMDILTDGPWSFEAPRAEAGSRFSFEPSCTTGSGTTTIVVDARPNAKELESYVRLGEAEHDTDTKKAFETNIGGYVANVNRLLSGDSPDTRVEASTSVECRARLSARENRDLLTQFVLDLNAATDKRHAGGRHGVAHTGLSFAKDCSKVTTRLEAGRL